MKVNAAHIAEQKELIASGDLDLDERKAVFRKIAGRDPVLNDEALLAACAITDDDDDELFVSNVKQIERDGYTEDSASAA